MTQANDGSFERYQAIQSKPQFKRGQHLASFVVTPYGETLFVGLYYVHEQGVAPPGTIDPVSGDDVGGLVQYDIRPVDALSEYTERLVIGWGSAYITWKQRATGTPKPILELRRSRMEPPFPGYLQFRASINELENVPVPWREALSIVTGVYVLVSLQTGKLYVGSAYGDGGFWSRWEGYARDGHGGNVLMRPLKGDSYQVAILEIASSTLTAEGIIKLETLWKQKLLSKVHGLNLN